MGDDAPELRGASHDVERPLSDCYAERVSKLSTLDPSLDVVFKLLLTSGPESNEVLVALLTAVLRPQKPFAKVVVRNPEIPREALENHGTVLDIFAELEDGTRLDIEMQSERRPSFRQRALYYWARMFGSELDRGAEYGRLRPAISVLFLGYRELKGRSSALRPFGCSKCTTTSGSRRRSSCTSSSCPSSIGGDE